MADQKIDLDLRSADAERTDQAFRFASRIYGSTGMNDPVGFAKAVLFYKSATEYSIGSKEAAARALVIDELAVALGVKKKA